MGSKVTYAALSGCSIWNLFIYLSIYLGRLPPLGDTHTQPARYDNGPLAHQRISTLSFGAGDKGSRAALRIWSLIWRFLEPIF